MKASDLPPHIRAQLPPDLQGSKTAKKSRIAVGSEDKRTYDGITFDSIWECQCYKLLRLFYPREQIQLQVKYELLEGYTIKGRKVRPINYLLDFEVDGICIDAKGHKTEVFRLKKKLFEYRYRKEIHCLYDERSFDKNMANIAALVGHTPP